MAVIWRSPCFTPSYSSQAEVGRSVGYEGVWGTSEVRKIEICKSDQKYENDINGDNEVFERKDDKERSHQDKSEEEEKKERG